jgi:hypothetical protein
MKQMTRSPLIGPLYTPLWRPEINVGTFPTGVLELKRFSGNQTINMCISNSKNGNADPAINRNVPSACLERRVTSLHPIYFIPGGQVLYSLGNSGLCFMLYAGMADDGGWRMYHLGNSGGWVMLDDGMADGGWWMADGGCTI